MTKQIDDNGYWFIKKNPISKVGVFPYLGRTISDKCIPDKIYNVLRPADTLIASIPSWDNPPKPLISGHEMLGAGFTSTDDRAVQGIISNPVFENDVLYADITVYSDAMKSQIESGIKELSLGYFCNYRPESGTYLGQHYDFVQTDMVGNHCALVEAGRCGSDVKVFDHQCTMDSLDINISDKTDNTQPTQDPDILKVKQNSETIDIEENLTTNKGDNPMADKREAIREIMAIAAKPDTDFDGGESEKIETIAKLLESSEYATSEKATDEDDADKVDQKKETEDKCGKDADEKATEDNDNDNNEILALLKNISERLDAVLAKKATDEDDADKKDDAKDEEEKKDAEDEDDKKSAQDGAVFDFGNKTAPDAADDPALKRYLA